MEDFIHRRSSFSRWVLLCGLLALGWSTALPHSAFSEKEGVQYVLEPVDADDDFDPGLGILALFAVAGVILALCVALALAILVLLTLAGLVATGIISVSVYIGLQSRSATKAFRSFVIISAMVGGMGAGILCAFIFHGRPQFWPGSPALAMGIALGILAGWLAGRPGLRAVQETLARLGVWARGGR